MENHRIDRRLYSPSLAVSGTPTASNSANAKKKKSEKTSLFFYRVAVYAVLIILSLICIFPFYTLLINCSWGTADIQQGFHWWFGNAFKANFDSLMSNTHIPLRQGFINSLIIAFSASFLTVYFSALTAYATHIYNFRGKKAITVFILAVMMIPTQVAAMGLVMMCMQLHWINQIWVVIVPAVASPVCYFYMKQYLESVLPFEIVEAARVDGASEIRIFHQIVLPILKPALAVQFIFAYVSNWNNYFIPAMLLQKSDVKTLPIVIAGLKASSPDMFDLGQVYMLMTIAVIPVVIVYLIFSRAIIKNLTSGAVKG
jgi:multiple sugar transport system permease protein